MLRYQVVNPRRLVLGQEGPPAPAPAPMPVVTPSQTGMRWVTAGAHDLTPILAGVGLVAAAAIAAALLLK
jgi:hypothetical protein